MLRRKRKKDPAPPEAAAAEGTLDEPQPDPTDVAPAPEPVPAAVADPPAAEPPDRVDDTEPDYAAAALTEAPPEVQDSPDLDELVPAPAEIKQRRPRYQPAEVPLATPYGAEEQLPVSYWLGSVKSVLTKSGGASPEEREREAAAEFQAAIMPGLVGLRDAVPDAASPDEALRAIAEREAEHEYPEDPEADSLTQRDIFQNEASVYYRIRNRFEKPRRRVGWGDPWRPPPGLARPDPPRRALNRPD